MAEKLITVATFSQAIEAHLSKIRLESEGIECFIADEHVVAINWFLSNAVGGVKLKVKELDAERAAEILRQEPVATDFKETKVNEGYYDEPQCPFCSSLNIYYEKFSRRLVFISILFLGFPFPFLKRQWRCRECGYKWKAR
ncbi:MAG: DUF2007 domain-containing protein [Thermodesulfobacteriota bacterium]|nr:DUF2007 domain-containing protein [Thermodesulfobacteriota bacterium]